MYTNSFMYILSAFSKLCLHESIYWSNQNKLGESTNVVGETRAYSLDIILESTVVMSYFKNWKW
jgi:hypothetical protein